MAATFYQNRPIMFKNYFKTAWRHFRNGLRKVLGASILSVWNLLSKDFITLVAISFIISMPLAYYLMHNWLEHYTYRTEIGWWIFALAGLGALLITALTVSFQAIRAAVANPVKALRSE